MIAVALGFLLSAATPEQTTLPRRLDAVPEEHNAVRSGEPTDPLFDKPFVATDDSTFVLSAIESARQSIVEAHTAADTLPQPGLRETAARIGQASATSVHALEALSKRKGWRVPQENPKRVSALATSEKSRLGADFIIGQIAWHQTTIEQFRAQIAGKGDPELKNALRKVLPAYQRNLDSLLTAKP